MKFALLENMKYYTSVLSHIPTKSPNELLIYPLIDYSGWLFPGGLIRVLRALCRILVINTDSWEDFAADLMMWRSTLTQHLKTGEKKVVNAEAERRARRKERNSSNRPETTHKCDFCGRDCFSHIGLYSHKRRCNNQTDGTTRMYSHDQTWSKEAI